MMNKPHNVDSSKINDTHTETPSLEQQDWEAIGGKEIEPESAPENGDLRYPAEDQEQSPEEDDDNPFGESDEALPDDSEEAEIQRKLERLGDGAEDA